MTISTTRRREDLQAECVVAGVAYGLDDSREILMDRLRAALGAFDTRTEVDPMKAQETKSLIKLSATGPDYAGIKHLLTEKFIAEPKYDGVRLRMFIGLTGSSLNTGRRSVKTYAYSDRTGNYPHLSQVCDDDLNGIILDGELLAPSPKIQVGKTLTDSILTASCSLNNSSPDKAVAAQKKYGNAEFWVFDILSSAGGESIQHLPYDARRNYLESVLALIMAKYPHCNIKLVPQMPATEATIRQAMLEGFEGVVLKDRNSPYLPGKRKGWHKVKTFSTADAFVCGWFPGENRNSGLVGSLELAVVIREVEPSHVQIIDSKVEFFKEYDNHHTKKFYLCRKVAQVGNLTDEMRIKISAQDGSLKPYVYDNVIEFVGQGLTVDMRVRHPHMVRLRPDKIWLDCEKEQLGIFPKV